MFVGVHDLVESVPRYNRRRLWSHRIVWANRACHPRLQLNRNGA